MDLGLKGKNVIISGGASNIGYGITLAFAKEGANVAIADIDEEQANRAAEKARSLGVKAMVVLADATSHDAVAAALKKVLGEFGKVDVLVNNVGWDRIAFFTETNPELWDRLLTINFKTDLNWISAVLPHMSQNGGGAIVNIGSDAGRLGEAREAVYSGCKGAVIAFSKAIAREAGRFNIRVNVVCPSLVAPEKPEEVGAKSAWKEPPVPPEVLEKALKAYPLRKGAAPKDIASAVVFLASDTAAGIITGQTLSVDGGYAMV
ncbi:MAG: SDR family oxidoreductase [Chloroflexi bacterium]|nr:SDR family oxidoreductase [Chloroflexota bacterium]